MRTRSALVLLVLLAAASLGNSCASPLQVGTLPEGTMFASPQTVTVLAEPLPDWPDASRIIYVEFFHDGVLVCRDFSVPYSCDWPITVADDGSHSWEAVATLGGGESVASGPRILVVAIAGAGPAEPELVGFVPDVGTARDVVLDPASGLAYVASDDFGVAVVDVSDPDQPVTIGGTVPAFEAHRVDLGDGLAVAAGPEGLHFVDVTDPSRPELISVVEGDFRAVAVSGDTVFARKMVPGNPAHVDLVVLDASQPGEPQVRAQLLLASLGDVAVDGAALYVGDGTAVKTFDVTNPQAPVLRSTLQLGHATRALSVEGSRLFVAGQSVSILEITSPFQPAPLGVLAADASDVAASGSWLHVATPTALLTVNVADASTPVLASSLPLVLQRLDVSAGRVFSTAVQLNSSAGTGGLSVTDVSVPGAPQVVSRVLNFSTNRAMAAQGSTAAAAGPDGLCILDVADPGRPFVTSLLEGNYTAVALVGERWAYARELVPGNPGYYELVVLDLVDPADPREVRRLPLSGGGPILVDGSWAYVGDGQQLRVYDARSASNPVQVASVGLSNSVVALAAGGGHLFAGGWDGVSVLSLASPSSPVVRSSLDLFANDLAAYGSQLAVVDFGTLTMVDVSDPQSPSVRGALAGLSSQGVALEGARAWVPTREGHVAVVDVSNADSPWLAGTVRVPGMGGDVVISDGLVLAGDERSVVDVVAP